MNYTVPVLSIVFIGMAMLMGIAIPVVLFIVFRKKYKCDVVPFFIGCAVMLVFAFILEGLAHKLILGSAAGAAIQGNVWLYALYGGFMVGLFEETGRLVAFKTVLKKYRGNDRNALMYGAGHGGFEAFYLLVVGLLNYFVYAVMLNSGSAAALLEGLDSDAAATLEGVFASIAAMPPATFLLSVVERGAAVLLQLSLSVLVWFAAKRGGRSMWLFALAILLHLAVDGIAVILSAFISQVMIIEAIIWAMAILCALLARSVWKRMAVRESANG